MIKKRSKTKIPKVLSQSEIQKLISLPSPKAHTGIRNKAIIGTFAYAGIRAMELVNLKVSDIDLKESWIHIKKGKTGDRDVPITLQLEPYLIAWNSLRPKHSRYFFTTLKGKRLSDRYIREMIRRLGERINLKVYPHKLRHSFATHTLKRPDINTRELQELLGHKALSSTQVYTHIEPKELHKKLREDKTKKKQDLNELYQQFLNTQQELSKQLAQQFKEMLNKALKED
ncbi:Tyrosine recombinase XerC [subsurface metagenome]